MVPLCSGTRRNLLVARRPFGPLEDPRGTRRASLSQSRDCPSDSLSRGRHLPFQPLWDHIHRRLPVGLYTRPRRGVDTDPNAHLPLALPERRSFAVCLHQRLVIEKARSPSRPFKSRAVCLRQDRQDQDVRSYQSLCRLIACFAVTLQHQTVRCPSVQLGPARR